MRQRVAAREHLRRGKIHPPTFEQHGAAIDAVLSDNGREFCGREGHFIGDDRLSSWISLLRKHSSKIAARPRTKSSGSPGPSCSTGLRY